MLWMVVKKYIVCKFSFVLLPALTPPLNMVDLMNLNFVFQPVVSQIFFPSTIKEQAVPHTISVLHFPVLTIGM